MKTLKIPINKGKFCLIDEADIGLFKQYNFWCAEHHSGIWYMRTLVHGKEIQLHRHIMKPPRELVIDHVNGDGLDNRRANLRICTIAENNRNRRKSRGKCSSQFKGVSVNKAGNWRCLMRHQGKYLYFGTFKEEIQAAKTYDKHAAELFGEFARLNFPKESSTSIDLIKETIHD